MVQVTVLQCEAQPGSEEVYMIFAAWLIQPCAERLLLAVARARRGGPNAVTVTGHAQE